MRWNSSSCREFGFVGEWDEEVGGEVRGDFKSEDTPAC